MGEVCAGAQRNHVPPRLAGLETAVAAQVEAASDQTLAQLCDEVKREHGVRVGMTTLWKVLRRLGLPLGKRPSMPASRLVRRT